MKKKWIFVPIILIVLLYIAGKLLFYIFVFNDGIPITQDDFKTIQKIPAGNNCSQTQDAQNYTLTMNFVFDYPFVDFKGWLIISDNNDLENAPGNILYSGVFKKTIKIEQFCYEPTDKSVGFTFQLMSRKYMYSWNTFYSDSVSLSVSEPNIFSVRLTYDDRSGFRRAELFSDP